MTRTFLLAVAAAISAAPAAAVQVVGIATPGGNVAGVFAAGPGVLQIDVALNAFAPVTFDLEIEAGDANGIGFDAVVDVFTGVTLGANLGYLGVSLVGGPTFATVGDVTAFFSTADVTVAPGQNAVGIRFLPEGEGFGLELGSPAGTGVDFLIAPGLLAAGDRFQLVLNPGAVPEPGTWAMLIAGFGLVGLAMRRRARIVPA